MLQIRHQRVLGPFAALIALTALVGGPALAAPQAAQAKPIEKPSKEAAPESGSDALDASLRALREAERSRASIDRSNSTVEAVLAELQATTKIPLRVDWSALERLGIDRDDPFEFHANDLSPKLLLEAIAMSLGSEIERPVVDAGAGQIVLTTDAGRASLRATAVYDVADVLFDPTLIDALKALAEGAPVAIDAPLDPAHGGTTSPATDETTTRDTDAVTGVEATHDALARRLVRILTTHVDPDGWEVNGGTRAAVTAEAGRLVVSATPIVHRRIQRLLAELRNESPLAAEVELLVGSIATKDLDALLAQSSSTRDDRSIADLVRTASSFTSRANWAPSMRVALDRETRLEGAISDAPDAAVCTAAFTPRFDRTRGALACAVSIGIGGPGAVTLATELAGVEGRIEDVLRLPGGPTAETTWVVLVRIERVRRG
jgi:hypothetical protein